MSIIEKMTKIVNEGDTAGAEQLIHNDFKFLMHSSGNSLSKKDVVEWIGKNDVKKAVGRLETILRAFQGSFLEYFSNIVLKRP